MASQGIPAYIEGKTGYFASKEIQDVLLFLKVLDNPLQDIPLYGVMKSVFGGFTEKEVAVLRSVEEKDEPLYENLRRHAEEKYAGFLAKIDRYREYATYMTILELLQTLFEEHDYLAYVSALPAGEKRLANAEMLLTKAAAYEKNSYYGLFHFIRYVEQLADSEQTCALAYLLRYTLEQSEANLTVQETVQHLTDLLTDKGWAPFCSSYVPCGLAKPRVQEIYACLNRFRS